MEGYWEPVSNQAKNKAHHMGVIGDLNAVIPRNWARKGWQTRWEGFLEG